MSELNKNEVLKTIEGYKKGEAHAKKERLKNLRNLSKEESITIYTNFWKIWKKSKQSADLKTIDRLKVEHLTNLRRKIDKLAKWKQSS